MMWPHPPKPFITGRVASATTGTAMKYPAGYRFCGKDVWRVEVSGTLPAGSGTDLVVYRSTRVDAPIDVRGWVKPVAVNTYLRPVTACRRGINGNACVYVRSNASKQLVVAHLSSITSFTNAEFRLQIDFIEV